MSRKKGVTKMSLYVKIFKHLAEFDLDVEFEVNQKVMGLMGASGSGKSMTLKCIAGIETPDKGKIVLNDKVLFDSEKKINIPIQKRNVGYLFQNYALFPNMNVYDNIMCGLKAHKISDMEEKIDIVLKQFHITELKERYPNQLSGGQKQRVALARLVAYNPDVLLFDEPFSALDEDLKEGLMKELKTVLSVDKPVIFVSHNKEEVQYLCERKYKIKQGIMEEKK